MGESKRRGSRSDRIKQAMDRQRRDLQVALGAGFNPMTLEELRADVGAPASAVFRGYVLHREEHDDFCSSDGRWVPSLDMRLFFPTFRRRCLFF